MSHPKITKDNRSRYLNIEIHVYIYNKYRSEIALLFLSSCLAFSLTFGFSFARNGVERTKKKSDQNTQRRSHFDFLKIGYKILYYEIIFSIYDKLALNK